MGATLKKRLRFSDRPGGFCGGAGGPAGAPATTAPKDRVPARRMPPAGHQMRRGPPNAPGRLLIAPPLPRRRPSPRAATRTRQPKPHPARPPPLTVQAPQLGLVTRNRDLGAGGALGVPVGGRRTHGASPARAGSTHPGKASSSCFDPWRYYGIFARQVDPRVLGADQAASLTNTDFTLV